MSCVIHVAVYVCVCVREKDGHLSWQNRIGCDFSRQPSLSVIVTGVIKSVLLLELCTIGVRALRDARC